MSTFDEALKRARRYATPEMMAEIDVVERYRASRNMSVLARLGDRSRSALFWLVEVIRPGGKVSADEVDAIRIMIAAKCWAHLDSCCSERLRREKQGDDLFETILSEARLQRIPWGLVLDEFLAYVPLENDDTGEPNSAGRLVATMPEADVVRMALQLWSSHRHVPLLDFVKGTRRDGAQISEKVWKIRESEALRAFKGSRDTRERLDIAIDLAQNDFRKYGNLAAEAARASLNSHHYLNYHNAAAHWLLSHLGKQAVLDVRRYVTSNSPATEADKERIYQQRAPGMPWFKQEWAGQEWYECSTLDTQQSHTVESSVKILGKDALPIVLAALFEGKNATALAALTGLIEIDDGSHHRLIVDAFARGLQMIYDPNDYMSPLPGYLALVRRWKPEEVEDKLWPLMTNKSKVIRESAALALVKIGDSVTPRAAKLLLERKAEFRLAGVFLLSRIGSTPAMAALEAHLDREENDAVRDAILDALAPVWEASGKAFTRAELEQRADARASKIKWPPAMWVSENNFLFLRYKDGSPVKSLTIRYILARQAMCPDIRPLTELKPLYDEIDRSTSGAFAVDILCGFVQAGASAKDKWALAIAGILGDDRAVEVISKEIRKWAEGTRVKLAEQAVQTLGMIGSNRALRLLDSLAIRYRSKVRSIGSAAVEAFQAVAKAQGVTVEELGDAVIPALGFQPGQPRLIECGGRIIEASIGLDFKLHYVDRSSGKNLKSLPTSAAESVRADFKYLAADLRDAAKAQVRRLENLLVTQRRWPVERWKELFLGSALMFPFAVRLVWAACDGHGNRLFTFRADGTALPSLPSAQGGEGRGEGATLELINKHGERIALPADCTISIVHPIELPEEERWKWLYELQEWKIEQPFPQMNRSVILATSQQAAVTVCKDYEGHAMNGMTFRGRAERLGWMRGSVCDAGSITAYVRKLPALGVDVFLMLQGMFMGMDVTDEIHLDRLLFVKHGSVIIGAYEYDEPEKDDDPRLIPLGQVPPIAFSETMGALKKITAKTGAVEED